MPSDYEASTNPPQLGPTGGVPRTDRGRILLPISLLAVSYVGYFKGTILLSWLGFDPTVFLVILLSVYLTHRALNAERGQLAGWLPIVGLWVLFIPGLVYAATSGYDLYKGTYLFTITLLTCLGPAVVLHTVASQHTWIWATFVAGVVLAVTVLYNPDATYADEFGRLTAAGASSIGVSRVIGAAFVIAVLAGFVSTGQRRLLSLGFAIGLGSVLILVGSRGPLLGGAVTLIATLVAAHRFRSSRVASIFAGVLGLAVAGWVAVSSESSGAERIVGFLTGRRVDIARESLISTSWESIKAHPLGIGWGGFARLSGPGMVRGEYPHNIFLEILTEGGWLAGLAFAVFAFFALRRLRAVSQTNVGAMMFALAVYWLVVAQTSSDINGNRATLLALSVGFIASFPNDREVPQAGAKGPGQNALQ